MSQASGLEDAKLLNSIVEDSVNTAKETKQRVRTTGCWSLRSWVLITGFLVILLLEFADRETYVYSMPYQHRTGIRMSV